MVLTIPVICVVGANAKELLMRELLLPPIASKRDLMDRVVDELIDRMRGHWLPHHADLHNTILGKPGHIAMSLQSRGFLPLQPLPLLRMPRPLFQNLPIPVRP